MENKLWLELFHQEMSRLGCSTQNFESPEWQNSETLKAEHSNQSYFASYGHPFEYARKFKQTKNKTDAQAACLQPAVAKDTQHFLLAAISILLLILPVFFSSLGLILGWCLTSLISLSVFFLSGFILYTGIPAMFASPWGLGGIFFTLIALISFSVLFAMSMFVVTGFFINTLRTYAKWAFNTGSR